MNVARPVDDDSIHKLTTNRDGITAGAWKAVSREPRRPQPNTERCTPVIDLVLLKLSDSSGNKYRAGLVAPALGHFGLIIKPEGPSFTGHLIAQPLITQLPEVSTGKSPTGLYYTIQFNFTNNIIYKIPSFDMVFI